jgi:hypothetical protein
MPPVRRRSQSSEEPRPKANIIIHTLNDDDLWKGMEHWSPQERRDAMRPPGATTTPDDAWNVPLFTGEIGTTMDRVRVSATDERDTAKHDEAKASVAKKATKPARRPSVSSIVAQAGLSALRRRRGMRRG